MVWKITPWFGVTPSQQLLLEWSPAPRSPVDLRGWLRCRKALKRENSQIVSERGMLMLSPALLSLLSLRTGGLRQKKTPKPNKMSCKARSWYRGGWIIITLFSGKDRRKKNWEDALPTPWEWLGSYSWRQELGEHQHSSWDKSPWHSVLTALPTFPAEGANLI